MNIHFLQDRKRQLINSIKNLIAPWHAHVTAPASRRVRFNYIHSLSIFLHNHFRFGLIFIKKIIKLIFFKNYYRFKSTSFGLVQFFYDKNRFKSVWLGFFSLTRFFQFHAYKTEPNQSVFFKILIGFFLRFGFFNFFFLFYRFNQFFCFFLSTLILIIV